MFSKNDERAHPSAAGGWDQPRQWGPRTRLIVGIVLVIVVIAVFIGIFAFAGENADKLPAEVGSWPAAGY